MTALLSKKSSQQEHRLHKYEINMGEKKASRVGRITFSWQERKEDSPGTMRSMDEVRRILVGNGISERMNELRINNR